MNLCFLAFMIFALFAVGLHGESYGQPALEPGESGVYVEVDVTDIVLEGLEAIGDAIVSFVEWLCFWCDD